MTAEWQPTRFAFCASDATQAALFVCVSLKIRIFSEVEVVGMSSHIADGCRVWCPKRRKRLCPNTVPNGLSWNGRAGNVQPEGKTQPGWRSRGKVHRWFTNGKENKEKINTAARSTKKRSDSSAASGTFSLVDQVFKQ